MLRLVVADARREVGREVSKEREVWLIYMEGGDRRLGSD